MQAPKQQIRDAVDKVKAAAHALEQLELVKKPTATDSPVLQLLRIVMVWWGKILLYRV